MRLSFVRELVHQWVAPMLGAQEIRGTRQLCHPEAEYSIHMVTCHRHVDMAMWCLKSFAYYVEESPYVTIHDDGTLTARDKGLLCSHLDRCIIIDRPEADERMNRALKAYPLCRLMRGRSDFYCALKLFDPPVYASTDVIVLMDSDILFFRPPSEFLDCVRRSAPCFGSDYQDAYAVPAEELQRRVNIDVFPKVNAGLVVLRRAHFDLDFMERYFSCFPSPIWDVNRHEQTLQALLLSRAQAHRLSDAYQISRQRICDATVSHHFVNDGSRMQFYLRGVRALKQSDMFTAISSHKTMVQGSSSGTPNNVLGKDELDGRSP